MAGSQSRSRRRSQRRRSLSKRSRSWRRDRRKRSHSRVTSRGRSRSKRRRSPSRREAIASPRAERPSEKSALDFLNKHAPEVPQQLRESAAQKLHTAGYPHEWQVVVMPLELLLRVLPSESAGLELTAVLHAQRSAAPATPRDSAVVNKLHSVIEHQKRQTKEAKRMRMKGSSGWQHDDNSFSVSGDEGSFDAASCLAKYGLSSVDQGHMISLSALKPIVRAAKKASKKPKARTRNFLLIKKHRNARQCG